MTPPAAGNGDTKRSPGAASAQPRVERTPANNLPTQLSSFIGREREIAGVEELLAGDARLLTLTGSGGAGKTRLAVAVAFKVAEVFEDGVWWVELAPISAPDLVAQTVASTLGLRETPGRSPTEALIEHLQSRSTLLVLDNCEHLIEASAMLSEELLLACPDLRILATSREALGVPGEVSWPVPPLSLPDPRRLLSAEDLTGYESTRLFVKRARAVRPDFASDERGATDVARICYRLDGMPLAIELAAARVKVLSVEQISSQLEDSLKLLTGGGRTALPRQKTLRAAIEWSHELLSEAERKLLGRLSVFAGGWTLEAAEAVGSGDDIEEGDVLELLSRLVDKSMVVAGAGGEEGASFRYRMLEPIRQYEGERLEESGEAGQARRRHAEFCLSFMEAVEPELIGPRQAEWLEEDHDNLRAAIRWALEQEETALRLSASAAHFWYPRGYLDEGRRYLEAALANDAGSPAARAKALTEVGWFALEQSDYEKGQRSLEESASLYRELDDKYGIAHALECLGVAKTRLGDYGRAAQLQEESLALYRELGHEWGIAVSLTNLGDLAQKQGEYERASAFYLESLSQLRVLGDSLHIGYVLSMLAQVHLMQGRLERSAALLEESQSLLRKLGNKLTLATALCNLGETMLRQGDGTRAAAVFRESLALAAEGGSKARVADCLGGLAEMELTHERQARAARLWGAAKALSEALGSSPSRFDRSHPDHEGLLAAARSLLGEAAWDAAWAEGRAMTPEQATDYALSEEEEPQTATPEGASSYPNGLSAREAEVLKLVAQGLTNAQVAQELFISPRTVNRHLTSVYQKLGVNTRAAATRFAVEHDLA